MALTVAAVPVCASDKAASRWANAIITNDALLRASLDRLYDRSRLWRAAVAQIESLGRRAVVVTPRHVRVQDPHTGHVTAFDRAVIAEVQPLAEHGTRVDAVVVVVNVELLQGRQTIWSTPVDLENDIDRVVAHEVYGHAIPYLVAGDLSGKCADPTDGERPEESCAIKRENAVRAESGLGKRIDSGVNGLSLARRYRH